MDAWWPRWLKAEFEPVLGKTAASKTLPPPALDNAPNNGGAHLGSAYQDGWYGYVSKDLRTLARRRSVQGRYARGFCGKAASRAAGWRCAAPHGRARGPGDAALRG